MAPESAFVSDFVGESNSLPATVTGGRAHLFDRPIDVALNGAIDGAARLAFRPPDVSVCGERAGCLPLLVTGDQRCGGAWPAEGGVAGSGRTHEIGGSAATPAPKHSTPPGA